MNARWGCVVCALVCAACSKSSGGDKKAAPEVPKHVTIEPVDNSTGGYDVSGYGVSGEVSFSHLTVDLKVPEGTTGTLDGRPLTVSGTTIKGPFVLGESAAEILLAPEVNTLTGMPTEKVTLKLALALPSGSTAEVSLPLDEMATKGALLGLLQSVQQGPVTFPGEAPATGPAKTATRVQLIDPGVHLMPTVGSGTKVKDVDLIAIDHADVRTVACPHEYTDGSNRYTVNRFVSDNDVHLFDRRTGKEVAAQKFAGKVPKCTRTTTGDFYGDENDPAITKWLTGQLAR